jgi:hypothetical protein
VNVELRLGDFEQVAFLRHQTVNFQLKPNQKAKSGTRMMRARQIAPMITLFRSERLDVIRNAKIKGASRTAKEMAMIIG